ncbi:MAG: hypothetical protein EXR58_02925 [Chloroflexi bacterium]|nr:hypothetical protein [Chloroflexota bacterium]
MAIFSPQDREEISKLLAGLIEPVRLLLFTIPQSGLIVPGRTVCETCDDTQNLMQELVELSDKLSLEIHHFEREPEVAQRYGVERVPSVLVLGPEGGRVRFSGAPVGREFGSLLQDIQLISRGETLLEPATREAIGAITTPINIRVFVTPT